MSESTAKPPAPSPLSLQRRYAPNNTCFGCGLANPRGLQLQSFVQGDAVVATFQPEEYQQAFPGVLNGGIIGALLDCHSNWTAAHALMQAQGLSAPPCTVTADFHVKLRAPTPLSGVLTLRARPVQIERAPSAGAKSAATESAATESAATESAATESADAEAAGMRCTVDAELSANGKVTATCRGTFVAVKPGHPAYHRW
jgi:acyl-coenzyme A thioesterase PaaI-like protein